MEAYVKLAKQELRIRLGAARMGMEVADRERADTAIEAKVLRLPQLQASDAVFCYCSRGSEVETRGILQHLWDANVPVALPRCLPDTHTMRWYRTGSLEGLEERSYGIDEPVPNAEGLMYPIEFKNPVVIVPAVAFDTEGYRLGHGSGYFDRFLADFNGITVGLCRQKQLVKSLRELNAVEAHDVPVNLVVTDKSIIQVGRE